MAKQLCPQGCGAEIDSRGLTAHLKNSRAHRDAGQPAAGDSQEIPGEPTAAAGCSQCEVLSEQLETLRLAQEKSPANSQESQETTPAALEIPDLATVVGHCEGGECPAHQQQLESFKGKVLAAGIEALPDDAVRQLAIDRGVMPSKIVLRGVGAR